MATVTGATVKWGTSQTTTYGEIQSLSIEDGAQTKEVKGADGETIAIVKWDNHKAINLTAVILSDSTRPAIHDVVTIEDGETTIKARVTSVSESQSSESEATITIAARTYSEIPDNATQTQVPAAN